MDERQRGVHEEAGGLGSVHPGDLVAPQFVAAQPEFLRWLGIAGLAQRQYPVAKPLELSERLVESVVGDRRRVPHVPLATQVPLAKLAGCIVCIAVLVTRRLEL